MMQRPPACSLTNRALAPQHKPGRPFLLLLLANNSSVSWRLRESLSQQYPVAAVSDVQHVLSSALERAPALIVAEVAETGACGEALLRALRSQERLARIPALCVTASAEVEHRARLLRAGAADCLSAPFSSEELLARVRNVLAVSREQGAQERLTALVDQSPDGIFVADAEGRFTDVNEAGCRLLGYARSEILGKTALDFVASEAEARAIQATVAELQQRGGGAQLVERVLRRKDGSLVATEVQAQILPDGTRQSFVRDLTPRKQVEAELRRSEARAASILATSADAIISTDVAGRITGWNQGAERIFGYSPDEALGAPLDLIIPARLRAIHSAALARFVAGAETARLAGDRSAQVCGLRKSGQEFPCDASFSKVVVDGDMILTVTLRDVTEQRRIESEQRFLAEAGAALMELRFEEALDKVVHAAREFLGDLAVLFLYEADGQLRPAAVSSHHLPQGRDERLLSRPLERASVCPVWRAFETRSSVRLELTPEAYGELGLGAECVRVFRAAQLCSILAVPLCAGDDCLGVLSLGSASRGFDARDAQMAEELGRRCALFIKNARLHQAEQRAIQVRDEILGVVAHDLRNPLNAIGLHLNLLLKWRNDPEGRWLHAAERIRGATQRMDRIIQDLLDVAQLESGALSMERRCLSVAQLMADAAEPQKPLAAASSLGLRLELAPDLPQIFADPHRLLQVFENLLGNAIKFSAPGGHVTIGADLWEGGVRFRVSDTGIGIPAEDMPHLFDRFWQARRADRRGVGLGLFIVKGIVAAHGGCIWAESTPGRGSTFYFTIPTSQSAKVE